MTPGGADRNIQAPLTCSVFACQVFSLRSTATNSSSVFLPFNAYLEQLQGGGFRLQDTHGTKFWRTVSLKILVPAVLGPIIEATK